MKSIYTLYIILTFVLLTVVFYPSILVLPIRAARFILKMWCKVLFIFSGCPIKIENRKQLKSKQKTIYVSNHASYMDSLLLIAALPSNVAFVAKKELIDSLFFKLLLKRVGYLTVDRMDFAKSLEDTKLIDAALDKNDSIMIFPEGTFTAATGVRPFRLGAFQIAVDNQTSLTPIAICGTRKLLRAHTTLLTPSRLSVWIGEPIVPQSNEFSETIRLRNKLREVISKACGERMINLVRAGPEFR